MATEIENTLENITSFSVSAVSSSMLEETNKTLRILESQLKLTQVKLKDLPEIKKDLQEMVLQCELVKLAKKSDLVHLFIIHSYELLIYRHLQRRRESIRYLKRNCAQWKTCSSDFKCGLKNWRVVLTSANPGQLPCIKNSSRRLR